jgi:hypothetical protein
MKARRTNRPRKEESLDRIAVEALSLSAHKGIWPYVLILLIEAVLTFSAVTA